MIKKKILGIAFAVLAVICITVPFAAGIAHAESYIGSGSLGDIKKEAVNRIMWLTPIFILVTGFAAAFIIVSIKDIRHANDYAAVSDVRKTIALDISKIVFTVVIYIGLAASFDSALFEFGENTHSVGYFSSIKLVILIRLDEKSGETVSEEFEDICFFRIDDKAYNSSRDGGGLAEKGFGNFNYIITAKSSNRKMSFPASFSDIESLSNNKHGEKNKVRIEYFKHSKLIKSIEFTN